MIDYTIHTLQIEKLMKDYRQQKLRKDDKAAVNTAELLFAEAKLLLNVSKQDTNLQDWGTSSNAD